MKSTALVVGAVALGTAELKGASVTDSLTMQERTKRWTISGSLRNFYDDNMFNAPPREALGSFGVEVSPGIAFNLPLQQTILTASYNYSAKYFEARTSGNIDQSHELDAKLEHRFSERYSLTFSENYRRADEPIVGNAQNIIRNTQDASNQRNFLKGELSTLMSPTFGWSVGADTWWQDYSAVYYSSVLDLVRQSFHADARWFQTEDALFFTGYAFAVTHYTYPEYLQTAGARFIDPSDKDSLLHRFYFGTRYELSRRLELSGRIGVDYTDYKVDNSVFSPYIDISSRFTYLPGSFVRLNVNLERYPAAEVDSLDQEILSFRMAVSHRLAARTTVGLDLLYQFQSFNDRGSGALSGTDDYYVLSTNAEYKIRENLFATLYYSLSQRVSGRSFARAIDFSRNELYWGLRFSY